jgi:hypothetical protein
MTGLITGYLIGLYLFGVLCGAAFTILFALLRSASHRDDSVLEQEYEV